jgi:hypothetical protein
MEIIRPLVLFSCLWLGGFFSASSIAASQTSSGVNILWVVDNLYMQETKDPQKMRQDMVSLISVLDANGEKYRMAVTTTDFFENDGKLVSDAAGISIVDSGDPEHAHKFMQMLANINPTASSFWPQGLQTATLALELNAAIAQAGTPLSIIFVSDEDDYSCEMNCYGVEPWDNKGWVRKPPSDYVSQFQAMEKNQGIVVTLYPIVGLPVTNCTISHVGKNYQMAQVLMGNGLSASVCPNDLAKSVAKVGIDIINNLGE